MSLLGLLVFSACSLEEKDFTEVEKGKFMRNAKEAETVLMGVYRPMKDFTVIIFRCCSRCPLT